MVEPKDHIPHARGSSKVILDNLPIEFLQYDAKISDLEVMNHPRIQIIEESGNLLKDNEININAKGLLSESYKRQNGIVLFGDDKKDEDGKMINDAFLNISDKEHKESTIFMIYYRRDSEKYFIKMVEKSKNFFCFAKLCEPLKIRTGHIISVFHFNLKFTINEENSLTVDYELENGSFVTK